VKSVTGSILIGLLAASGLRAGPYSLAADDPSNALDAPIPGFVGPDGDGLSPERSSVNYVNPLFFGWGDSVADYTPSPGGEGFADPHLTLGPVTGDALDVASLGELSVSQIASSDAPGQITLTFSQPIKNLTGGDFVIFENGLGSAASIFGELAYVEVSSDGNTFARFPSVSLTAAAVSQYGQFNPTDVFNLAGKHMNAYGGCWGTPFDLANLSAHPLVTSGQVNLQAITHIRVVDIPGTGFFRDEAASLTDPTTGLAYTQTHPVYDAHETYGSGGFDLEAVGVVSREMTFAEWQSQRGLVGAQLGDLADPDADGIPNLIEYATARLPDRADSGPVTVLAMEAGRLVLTFDRDERASDLIYDIEASNDLITWTVIARSEGGSQLSGIGGHSPAISETSASPVASVGVLRRVSVTDTQPTGARRFLRLNVIKP